MLSFVPADPIWILAALALGLGARALHIPPLVGFLAAGFLLNFLGLAPTSFLEIAGDLGVTLLLFTIGLHVSASVFVRTEVWGVASLHVVVFGAIMSALIYCGVLLELGPLGDLDAAGAIALALALSFSSTVFAAKVLEAQGAEQSRHGRIAIGVLIIQDLIAVAFLAMIDSEARPSPWALALLLLPLLRKPLHRVMRASGHGELLLLFGILAAAAGSGLFQVVGLKGDLGALAAGLLLAGSAKADELGKVLDGFKDLFLAGFFVGVGLGAPMEPSGAVLGLVLLIVLPLKGFGFFALFSLARVRARTAWQGSLELTTFSEFGLIVVATSVETGLMPSSMLTTAAVAVAASLVIASPVVLRGEAIYDRWRPALKRWERSRRLPGDEDLNLQPVSVMVFGMGRIGYRALCEVEREFPGSVLGVDADDQVVARRQADGHYVVDGDATDPEFWARTEGCLNELDWVLLTMSSHEANMTAVSRLRSRGFTGSVMATTLYPDEADQLRHAGADAVFDIYTEAGAGFAADLERRFNGYQTGVLGLDEIARMRRDRDGKGPQQQG